jgi:NADP-dependent 3-hydroxy acid dehydrogenase YdfG/aryl carrier-like protein
MTSKPKFIAFESATYVIAGGLGGIGRRIASWLAARGAKYLILLSRTGLEGDERRLKLIDELCSQGVEVRCPRCDISNMDSLKTTLETCSDMPPIRGCFHAAMSIRDSVFSELSIANWQQCTLPKIQGSWNLHLCMPEELDFFILLSSACGIFGNAGQSSYAAGNTFLDALAQFRTARGQKSIALDLGMLLGEGYVAENEDVMARLLRMHVLLPMALEKILIMFDFYCSTSCEYSTQHSQMCSGFELSVKAKAEGMDIHTTMLRPLFRHMHQIKSSEELRIVSKSLTRNFRALFIEASTVTEARSIAAEALQHKLSRVLGLSVANIALDQHLEAYGVDSLVALELRNWMTREMGADVAIFELLGGTTLVDIGKIITSKSSLRVSN